MPSKPHGRPVEGAFVRLPLRLSPAEARFVQRAADGLGISQNQFVRALIVNTFYDWNTPTTEEDQADARL